jgi:hypothetical protein
VAAILWFLGHDASREIGHKDWAGAKQGKWDPGGIDTLGQFRRDVQAAIDAGAPASGKHPIPLPPIGELTLTGNDAALVVAAAKKILATEQPDGKWYSRAMFGLAAEPAGGVDDTVGMLLNADANAWNLLMVLGALLGVEHDMAAIKDAAAGKFPKGGYIAENKWLQARATEFAKLIEPLCGALATLPGRRDDKPPPPPPPPSPLAQAQAGGVSVRHMNAGDE